MTPPAIESAMAKLRKCADKTMFAEVTHEEAALTNMGAALTDAQNNEERLEQRIAALESEIENERARGVHTCHDQFQRPLCVAQRRIVSLESALSEAVEIMVHGEKLLPKGEARFRAILENKDPT